MALGDDLKSELAKIFRDNWDTRDGTVVPDAEDLGLGNEAVKLEATVLYADMAGSTKMVDNHQPHFAAEVYKAYLRCAAKVIGSESGAITAYDGDRIMAVFIGDDKSTRAVRTAMKINYARLHIVNPGIKVQYANSEYEVHHSIGVDTSAVFVARTGIRGANDLVWVGRAANYAAKLSSLPADYCYITDKVYKMLHVSTKLTNGTSMWEERSWTDMSKMSIYRSNWYWKI